MLKKNIVLSGLGLLLFAVGSSAALLSSTDQIIGAAQTDSVVQMTAEAQGLQLLTPDQVPRGGTFWWMTPNGNSVPLPCPPSDPTIPIYLISPGQFLVDETGGKVVLNSTLARLTGTTPTVASALEAQANAVVNLIAQVQATAAAPKGKFGPSMMMASSFASSYAYGNSVFLSNMVATVSSDGSMTASFSITGGTNLVPYDIWMTTNLLNSFSQSQWTWVGIGFGSYRYTFTNQPADMAFYALGKPQRTIAQAWGSNGSRQSDIPKGLTNAVQITGGSDFSTALKSEGKVVAWGSNTYGQTNVPADLTNATVVVAGYVHNIALRSDGTLTNWGRWQNGNNYPVPTIPAGLTNVVAIGAGVDHDIVALADGSVMVWGYTNESYNTPMPGTGLAKDVSAGWNHNVALLTNGNVVAWGMNYGIYGWNVSTVPAGLSNVVAIATGGYHTLALKSDGTVVAWGAGNSPSGVQMGDKKQSIVPSGLSNVVAIAAGGYHSMALKSDGTVVMWGDMGMPGYQPNHILGIGSGSLNALTLRGGPFGPPVITSQSPMPTNQVGVYQKTLTLSVTATGEGQVNGFPLSYQWQCNGANLSGANSNSLTFLVDTPNLGTYSVIVSNGVGSVTSLPWQVTMTYTGSYTDVGTLAYHLATNAAARTNGALDVYNKTLILSGWTYATYTATNMGLLTNSVWSTNFWLKGVSGLSATPIGGSNNQAADGLMTMVSPRHYLFATHMGPDHFLMAFLDTNNVIFWRKTIQRVNITSLYTGGNTNDISVGILDEELPPSVGFLPVLPTDYTNYLPDNATSFVQGIGMNQDMRLVSQPMALNDPLFINWNPFVSSPFGLTTDWNVVIRGGDSSDPEMLLIGNQLVLAAHNYMVTKGPNYGATFNAINQHMHYLSTNNAVGSDYQLTPFSLTNWPTIH